jgi:hypothetical protein
MLKRSAVRRLLPAGLMSGAVGLALLLPAGPLAAVFAGYGYSYGGILASGPGVDAISTAENVFVAGQDNALWYQTVTPNVGSTGWISLKGRLKDNPGATQVASGNVYVFVRGQDDAVYYQLRTGTAWATDFVSVGGRTHAGIGVASGAVASQVDVFVMGQDTALWTNHALTPGGWTTIGGRGTSQPQAVDDALGSEFIFVRGTDNSIWWNHSNGTVYNTTWTSIGGVALVGAAASSCAAGHVDVFTVGQDKALWTRGTTNGGTTWTAWHSFGGVWSSELTAQCRRGSTTIADVYGRGQDFKMWSFAVPAS